MLRGGPLESQVQRLDRGLLKITPIIKDKPKVSVVVCFRDKADYTIRSVQALIQSSGNVDLEIILVNNQSKTAELALVQSAVVRHRWPAKIVSYDNAFNYADMHNRTIEAHVTGDYLLFLNNDVFIQQGTVEEMVAWAQLDCVGTVGALLRYDSGSIQHGGVRAFHGSLMGLARFGHHQSDEPFVHGAKEVMANTFALCLVRRELFKSVGGLRPLDIPNGFGDVAFNFECVRAGKHNVYLGYVSALHLESASRAPGNEHLENSILQREYPDLVQGMLERDLTLHRGPEVGQVLKEVALRWVSHQLRSRLPALGQFLRECKAEH